MLLFEGPDGQILIQQDDLVVTLDESGDPLLKDPRCPLFGIGACAVRARDYVAGLSAPWLGMKDREFGGRGRPLHATDLRSPTAAQIEALNRFFTRGTFARLGAFVTGATVTSPVLTVYQTVSQIIARQVSRVVEVLPCRAVTLLVESSEKYDDQFCDVFSTLEIHVMAGAQVQKLPVRLFRASKNPRIPSLEVADFVAHTAGTATRASLKGQLPIGRPDMRVVFPDVSPMSQYMRIDSVFSRGVV